MKGPASSSPWGRERLTSREDEPSWPSTLDGAPAAGGPADGAVARQGTEHGIEPAEFLRPLFAALNARGAEYVVLRNHARYPTGMHKPDVGLLVSERHLELLAEVVVGMCEARGWAYQRDPARRDGLALTALELRPTSLPDGAARAAPNAAPGRPPAAPRVRTMKVDARAYVTLPPDRRRSAQAAFAPRVFYEDVRRREVVQDGCSFWTLDGPDELVFLLAQWRRKGDPRYRRELLAALEDPELRRWFRSATDVAAPDLSAWLAPSYRADYDRHLAALVARRWGCSPARALAGCLKAARIRLRALRPPRAPLIYLAGPDGCGKTTVNRALDAALEARGIPHVRFYALQRVLRLVRRRSAWAVYRVAARRRDPAGERFPSWIQRREHEDRDPGRWSWRARRYLELWAGAADVFLGAALAEGHRRAGQTVLVETSPFDLFVKYHMPEFARTEALLARLMPRPSLGLLLAAPPAEIAARKPDLIRSEVAGYYARLERVLARAAVRDAFVSVATCDGETARAAATAARRVLAAVGEAQLRQAGLSLARAPQQQQHRLTPMTTASPSPSSSPSTPVPAPTPPLTPSAPWSSSAPPGAAREEPGRA